VDEGADLRVVLRQWRDEDREPFARLNADRRSGSTTIVSFTTVLNTPSRSVMERIGMTHDASRDFDHPNVPDGPLKRHLFYAIARAEHDSRLL
jgi:hypothetical protein